MDELDLRTRNVTYGAFVALGRAPTIDEVAARRETSAQEIRASWLRLHDAHAIVLHPDGDRLLMANPFSAVPTAHKVHVAGRMWDANCAWDAFGICAALHADGHISTVCPDCNESIEIDVVGGEPSDTTLLFHSLITAAHWWDAIAFT